MDNRKEYIINFAFLRNIYKQTLRDMNLLDSRKEEKRKKERKWYKFLEEKLDYKEILRAGRYSCNILKAESIE